MLKQDSFVEHLNQETVNDDQQDATTSVYLFIPNQLYVFSGDVFAHHQEHLTVFTASNIVHRYCCRLVSWVRWNISSMCVCVWCTTHTHKHTHQ